MDGGSKTGPRLENLLGPYERWMFGPGRTYDLAGLALADQAGLSCVAEAAEGFDLGKAARLGAKGGAAVRVVLPPLYAPPGFVPRFLPFVMVPGSRPLDELGDAMGAVVRDCGCGRGAEAGYRMNFPVRTETLDGAYPRKPKAGSAQVPGKARPLVIAAVIDDGIPFAHRAFRDGLGPRIDYCWSQGARAAGGDGAVPFGREFTRDGIEALLREAGGDEDAVYRRAGLTGVPGQPPMPLDLGSSHGAHVLGTMAGDWPEETAAQVRIIAVDLPATSTWETSGFGTDMFILAGLHYIFDRARRIAAAAGLADSLPVVVNLSFGCSGGPHDGSGCLEAAMDEIVAARRALAPMALVMPSGNSFQDRLTAVIGDGEFAAAGAEEVAELGWRVPPDDRTSTFAEFWLPSGAGPEDLRIEVVTPRGEVVGRSDALPKPSGSAAATEIVVGGKMVGQFALDRHRGLRWRFTVILAPSDPKALPPGGGHGSAPAGAWRIRFVRAKGRRFAAEVRGTDKLAAGIECRIQIDINSLQGKTGARQSQFTAPAYVPLSDDGAAASDDGPGPIRRHGSLNGFAANATALVVGGTVGRSGLAVDYSGAGALRRAASGSGEHPFGKQVDLSAMSDRSSWLEGIRSCGTRSGIAAAMNGTSVAAPQVARRLIERFLDAPPPASAAADNYLSALVAGGEAIGEPVTGETGRAGRRRLGRFRLHALPENEN